MLEGPRIASVVVLLSCVAALTGTIAVLGQAYLYEPVPRGAEAKAQDHPYATKEHQKSENSPVLPSTLPTADAGDHPFIHKEIASPNHREPNGYADPEWWIFFATVALVGVTGALWWVTWGLWESTLKAVADSEQAAKVAFDAVAAANRHADESANLVTTTKVTAERQLRAYISVTPNGVNWPDARAPVWITILIENHGQTIGFAVRYEFGAAMLDRLPIDAPMPPTDKSFAPNNSLFPRMSVPALLNSEIILAPADRRNVEMDVKRFYIWGRLHYRDAFNEDRQTRFFFSFGGDNFNRSMRGITGATWSWEYGQFHNDAT